MIRDALLEIPSPIGAGPLLAEARARLTSVHHALVVEAGRKGAGVMMASTVVVLMTRNTFFAALRAGDSRLYLLRDGSLSQVTRDHSLVQEMVDRGQLRAD